MIGVKLFLCAVCLVAIVSAFPAVEVEQVGDLQVQQDNQFYEETSIDGESKIRAKRATCDLFSYGGKVNHSACAAHCLFKGFRGGWCSSRAVCNCRR